MWVWVSVTLRSTRCGSWSGREAYSAVSRKLSVICIRLSLSSFFFFQFFGGHRQLELANND